MEEKQLTTKLSQIEMLVMDCDGVLTDGRIYYGSDGTELKTFHSRDGKGIKLVQESGVTCVIITGRESVMVDRRAEELEIAEVFQGISQKGKILDQLLDKYELNQDQVAYIGDDLNDLPALKKAGTAATVADGVKRLQNKVDYVTSRKGGEGAVRELIELILAAKTK